MLARAMEIRKKYDRLNEQRHGGPWSGDQLMAGFVGDVGDLSKIIMAKNGYRAMENVDEKLKHELADCLWSVMVIAAHYNIDLEQAFTHTMQQLGARVDDALKEQETYIEASLCFPVRDGEVLLAEKQRKLGAGFLNGFGGKREPSDRDIYSTNAREVEEEIGIRVTDVKKVGEIAFRNPSDSEPKRTMVHIFIATKWDNEPVETDEMKKVAWYEIEKLDYDKFLPADRLFLPQILDRKCVKGVIEYNDDWSVENSRIEEVGGF